MTEDPYRYLESVGSLFQYLTAISIFGKIFALYFDVPRHLLEGTIAERGVSGSESSESQPDRPTSP
jgi:hypothetical protein